jgi:single-strand DNA-binding protein
VFGRTAETASNYLSKGRRIGVDGRLSWREWEAQDGGKRQAVEVVANDIFFLDSRGDSGEGGSSYGGAERGWGTAPAPVTDLPADTSDFRPAAPAPADDDDIPF